MRSELKWRGALALAVATFGVAMAVSGVETPASADWQYTQWGMSPADVQAASDGTAVVNQDRSLDAADLKAGLTAFYRGDKRPFTAVFLFDSAGKLATVTLNPTDRISCGPIRQSLDAHYGTPASLNQQQFGQTARWNDVEGDNVVVFLDLGQGNCSIQYSSLPPTHQDGGL